MRYLVPIVLAAVMSLASAPSEAAPQWIERACSHEASKRSFNGRGEREQFVTNCIADLTAKPPEERRRYKLRYGY